MDDPVVLEPSALEELSRKVQGTLHAKIQKHVATYTAQQGLDFLHTKNSVMLSYLIELTYQMRLRHHRCGFLVTQETPAAPVTENYLSSSNDRLLELRTILEKMWGLDKKLRYQIDKLLSLNDTNGQNLATAVTDDPLLYRPGNIDDEDDNGSTAKVDKEQVNVDDDNSDQTSKDDDDDDDDDDDLATARQTVALAKTQQKSKFFQNDDTTAPETTGLYKAPRHAAVPYRHDTEDRELQKQLRRRRQLRDSEVAEAIRHNYSDAPEMEDASGGAAIGRQRAASRTWMEQQRERERFEEEHMMRLTVTRSDKKNRKRLMRDEMSNLSAIADLGNISKESKLERKLKQSKRNEMPMSMEDEAPKKRSYDARPRNSLQADIFGGEKAKRKKKGKR